MKSSSNIRFIEFNEAAIAGFLLSREAPVTEAELLRHMTGKAYLSDTREELFSLHFSLYHALYMMRLRNDHRGYYLHLDPMRIRFLPLAGKGRCGHYHPPEGRFCGRGAVRGGFCGYHEREADYLSDHPSYDPLHDFYSNPDNISFGASDLLERLMKGVILYSLKRGEIDEALKFFGISSPSRRLIQKRYHELARAYHPDLKRGNDAMMKQLNRFYQVLREIFVV